MSSRAILKRLKRLERLEAVLLVGEKDEWIDVVMWDVSGGVFGHSHFRFSKNGGETVRTACSDEEELEIMRRHYEDDGHRLHGRGEEFSFAEYLERFSYLGSEAFSERRKSIIERVRNELNGARVTDSSC